MTDHEFLAQFETCTLPAALFKHQGHLRVAWLYLNQYMYTDAVDRIRNGIKRYAASLGASHIYHETITLAWVQLVNAAIHERNAGSFSEFYESHLHLHNSKLLLEYYSSALLADTLAKHHWVTADIKPLPANLF